MGGVFGGLSLGWRPCNRRKPGAKTFGTCLR